MMIIPVTSFRSPRKQVVLWASTSVQRLQIPRMEEGPQVIEDAPNGRREAIHESFEIHRINLWTRLQSWTCSRILICIKLKVGLNWNSRYQVAEPPVNLVQDRSGYPERGLLRDPPVRLERLVHPDHKGVQWRLWILMPEQNVFRHPFENNHSFESHLGR